MKAFIFTISIAASAVVCCSGRPEGGAGGATYRNPVVDRSLPDPTVMKADDGFFYLYATEDIARTPIFRSKNLVDWEQAGAAFTEETRPSWEPKGGVWAPDINVIGGRYVLYYSMSRWGGVETCGIGVATSDRPDGGFVDRGAMFRSNEIGVTNSIDQNYVEEGGKKYLAWGSFHGVYIVELSDDGLTVRPDAEKRQIAGSAFEGTCLYRRGGYWYLFASVGTCCEGEKSTYTTVVGRSVDLMGEYVDRSGRKMLDNAYEVVVHGNGAFAGTGHNAEIVSDDSGDDWILYHAYRRSNPKNGRVLLLDRIVWTDGWPAVERCEPSEEAAAPRFGEGGN